jgi:hypothetical protein
LQHRKILADPFKPRPVCCNQAGDERASLLDLGGGEPTSRMGEKAQEKVPFTTAASTPFRQGSVALMRRAIPSASPASQLSGASEQEMAAAKAARANECTMGTTTRR